MSAPLKFIPFLASWLAERGREVARMVSDLQRLLAKSRVKKKRPPASALPAKKALVKNRPASLEQRYQLIEDQNFGDEVFLRLQGRLFALADQGLRDSRGAKIVYKERGRINPDRPYFFLKPNGAPGLLFERNGPGWVVSRAEKIVDRDLFLREGGVLEHAHIFLANDRAPLPRIKSEQISHDLLAYAVYEQKLLKHLGLE